MPRLSLWKPTKTNDFKFFDNTIREQFNVGGTGAIVHKFLGPEGNEGSTDPTLPDYDAQGEINETKIQDLLFLENRDRKYEQDLYELRGVYNVSDNDFDLTQFGFFLTNDVLYMTFHTNAMVEILGRRLMDGDVIELPHLLDDLLLDADAPAVPKFFVVQDGNRGSEGYSATWYSHIWRVKLGPITESQEYKDILGTTGDPDSLKNLMSTFTKEINITDAIVESASINDPVGGGTSLTGHLYNFSDADGNTYFHGETITQGSSFPTDPNIGDFFIRSDFQPNRMFTRRDSRWVRIYDNVDDRTWSDRTFNGSTFINNVNKTVIKDREFDQRQSITDAILPRTDYDTVDTLGENVFGSITDLDLVKLATANAIASWTSYFSL